MRARHGPTVIDVHHVGAQQTGNETWSANVARELARLDGSFVFASGRAGQARVEALTGRAPQPLPDESIRRLAVGLPRLLRRVRSGACLVSYTPPLAFGTPLVIAIHDLSAFDPGATAFLTWRTAARYRLSIRLAARRAAMIIVPTQFTADDLLRATGFPQDRTVIVGIPVDPAFHELLLSPRPIRGGEFRILLVGTLLPRKNARVVADAVALLIAEGSACHLRVVGPVREAGRDDETYLNAVLGTHVSWSGYVSNEALAQEYLSADVLAFPSLYEGFGIPILEAMAAGTAVVASDASCLPEVVADAGLLVSPYDAKAWGEAFRRLLTDPDLAGSLAIRGRVRAADFSWEESAAKIHRALQRVAAQSEAP